MGTKNSYFERPVSSWALEENQRKYREQKPSRIRITLLGRSSEDIAKEEIPDHLRAHKTRKHMKDSFIHPVLLLVQIVHKQKMDGLSD
ncbi:hypothetical protein ACJIZ3_018551 [Penstemon smallii]|uniref:Uncharacterized protein n=1 Tax=Penstemon smallii TaxID=265156 RepID=A0ABD3SYN4_9LAMI